MKNYRPGKIGRKRVSIRVLLPQSDYRALADIAGQERTDISTLVRRALAHYFFIPNKGNNITDIEKPK
ncbi:MAG: hypothetical protein AAC990_00395 [Dehalococcoides mccartyi]|jgi:hypothetical protein|uniref:hypothetical protein n=1 Tax=Dehalococcoides mccartyi TaxID=61435 RepID=UPI0030FC961E